MKDNIFDAPPNKLIEFEFVNAFDMPEKNKVLGLFMPLNKLLDENEKVLGRRTLAGIPDYYYYIESDQIDASKIAPGKKMVFSNGHGEVEWEGHMARISAIASGDFRNFLEPQKTKKDRVEDNYKDTLLEDWVRPSFNISKLQSQFIGLFKKALFKEHISSNVIKILCPVSDIYESNLNATKILCPDQSEVKSSKTDYSGVETDANRFLNKGQSYYDIKLAVVDNHTVNIYWPSQSKPKRYDFKDFMAGHKANKLPLKHWFEFIACIENRGILKYDPNPKNKDARKQIKSKIKKC